MAEDNKGPEKKGLDRRSLLTGVGIGAVGAAAVAVGANEVRNLTRPYVTPKAVAPGEAAKIATSFADSRPAAEVAVKAPDGAPNIIVVVMDDVGYSDLGCYGGEIKTPVMDKLAGDGLRYANFRTCAMCSPTRAALLTGLNHHSAGMGWLADIDAGYPGYRGDLTHEAATTAEILRDAGWSTFMVGKWHVNYVGTNGATGPYVNWPTHRGFERAYWFQGHSSDFFRPSEMFDGVAPVEPPEQEDFYLSDHLAEKADAYIRTQKVLAPAKPFYLHLAFAAAHSPLQVRARDRDAYQGLYDAGWDAVRAERLKRQRAMGLVPDTTELPPIGFGAKPWAELTADEKKLFARYMEVYAGMITAMDRALGRLVATLEDLGQRDNTLIMIISDNGGSAEGTPTGTPNVFAAPFGRAVPVEEALKHMDKMGEDPSFPHYPIGWTNASNTPYRLYKQYAHLGGVADPLIISWPKGIKAKGEIRQQFVHVIDLAPTLLAATGIKRPDTYAGRPMKPLEGQSILGTFESAAAPTRTEQYFELGGNRAYLDGNFRLVAQHVRGKPFEEDKWELYDLSKDPNETKDLAAAMPDMVEKLKAKWHEAALKYNVYPLDDRNLVIRMVQERQAKGLRPKWEIKPPIERLARDVAPVVSGLNHTIEVELEIPPGGADGVLVAHGSQPAGYTFFIAGGKLHYEQSLFPWSERISSPDKLPEGKVTVKYVQTMTSRPFDGKGAIFVNGRQVAERTYARVLFSTSYDGFSVGADLGNRVSAAYQAPNPFKGTIKVVRIDVDTTPTSLQETQRFLKEMGLRV